MGRGRAPCCDKSQVERQVGNEEDTKEVLLGRRAGGGGCLGYRLRRRRRRGERSNGEGNRVEKVEMAFKIRWCAAGLVKRVFVHRA
uniref:Uncharacterized protein n=1 Tax=Cannabis sativa TaxID=3483 RepID=A0A803QNU9_CANSA